MMMKNLKDIKIAIVHDYLNQYGGAERVLEVFHEIFPDSPIFTSIYLPHKLPNIFKKMAIHTSFMQKFPFLEKHFKKYLMIYPLVFQWFNLSDYDLVLSSSSAFAKGVKVSKSSLHLCYCYSPMRFVWDYERYISNEPIGRRIKSVLPFFLKKIRKWDLSTNKNVNLFIAISNNIKQKIKMFYGRDSIVIYPPVSTEFFNISNHIDNYYLIVSRLNAYKGIDLVIDAFNKIKKPLRIIGTGPHESYLKMKAHKNIEFLGKVPEPELRKQYSQCKAFIFPGEEDFGIAPLEAQASGRPVIAYGRGGALETIVEGKTGLFFYSYTSDDLINTLNKFEEMEFSPQIIRQNAIRFDKQIFKENILNLIGIEYNKFVKE
ncbi:MAG: glycosyltransferase [Nitrospiria bacterium]